MSVDYIGYVYALTIAVGGIIGFLTKGNNTSNLILTLNGNLFDLI